MSVVASACAGDPLAEESPSYSLGRDVPLPQEAPSRPEEIRVPGAKAGTYSGRSLFNSFMRFIFQSKSGLGRFARSLTGRLFCPGNAGHSETCYECFPMPLPYPEVFRKGWRAESSEVARKKGINALVLILNYLHLGQPASAPEEIAFGRCLTRVQWKAIRRLEGFLEAWLFCCDVDPEAMGRSAAKVESIEEEILSLEKRVSDLSGRCGGAEQYFPRGHDNCSPSFSDRHAGVVVGRSSLESFSTFKAVEPERLSFTGLPSFDPTPFLDSHSAEVFNRPLDMSLDPNAFAGQIPFVQVHCPKGKKIKLFELLDSTQRLALFTRDQIRPRFASGLFSVVKSMEKDRLILDARPSNLLEVPEQRWIRSMAAGEGLTQVLLPAGHVIRSSGNDIRDFYYLFRVSEQRARRNALAGAVDPKKLSHLSCYRPELAQAGEVYGALATLAMGDSQAVSLAQTCHLAIALQSGIACPENLLTLSGICPRSRTMVGIVIDDFVSLSIDPTEAKLPTEGANLAEKMQERYEQVDLIPHKGKAFRDELNSSFWGVDLDGSSGLLRGSLKRAIPLFGILLKVSKLGFATVSLLEVLAGSVVSLFLFRRRFLSCLDCIFQAVRGRHERDIIQLSGKLRGELLIIAGLLPLACTNLKATLSSRVTATDASDWGEAAVVSKIPSAFAEELFRRALRKSMWTRLLPPGKAWEKSHGCLAPDEELPDGETGCQTNPLWEIAATCFQYSLLFKSRASSRRHINVGELRAYLRAEKMLGRQMPSTREVFGLDSQVCLGLLCKGRSASGALNRELWQSVPTMVCQDTYGSYMYFMSALNPADDPTRGQEIRMPCRDLPSWWNSLVAGDFDSFDSWLEANHLGFCELAGLPDFSELGSAEKEPPQNAQFLDLHDSFVLEGFEDSAGVEWPRCQGFAVNATLAECKGEAIVAEPITEETIPLTSAENVFEAEAKPPEWLENYKFFATQSDDSVSDFSFEIGAALATFDRDQFILGKSTSWPPTRPGYLDLFSGIKGVATYFADFSGSWSLTFELNDSPRQNLADKKLQRLIVRLIRLGVFLAVGAAPICSSFSVAVTPPVRNVQFPLGVPWMSLSMTEKVELGNDFSWWLLDMLESCLDCDVVFWVENPDLSWIFRLPSWRAFLGRHATRVGFWRFDQCRFSRPWRKRTKVLTNGLLRGWCTFCFRDHGHQVLRGRSKYHRKNWTAIAQAYPTRLSKFLALSICFDLGIFRTPRNFNPAECARAGKYRVGEAANPGPVRSGLLQDVPLVEAKTAALQLRVWQRFERWVREQLTTEAATASLGSPITLCLLVKEFGNVLYSSGASLYLYRHLVVYVHKHITGARFHSSICWEMVQRWENLEPPIHRVPIPLSVVKAMVSIALCWNWPRFAGAICISFFGITRPGEVLSAVRRDLVLATDLLVEDVQSIFLCIRNPKARRRGRGRVQHASISQPLIVSFITKVFEPLGYDQLLYPISPASFRRRWDRILRHLGIFKRHKLTPGSLRGGGALEEYRTGTDLTRIMWRMRVKQIVTLENYIQEVAGESFLAGLDFAARRNVQVMAELFEPCLQVFLCSGTPT